MATAKTCDKVGSVNLIGFTLCYTTKISDFISVVELEDTLSVEVVILVRNEFNEVIVQFLFHFSNSFTVNTVFIIKVVVERICYRVLIRLETFFHVLFVFGFRITTFQTILTSSFINTFSVVTCTTFSAVFINHSM